MILSMTGFGEVQHVAEGVSYVLELRSLNSRYFKANIKLAEHLSVFESEVDKLLRARLTRGSIFYTLRVKDTRAEAAQEINQAALQSYVTQMKSIADGSTTIDLASLVLLPGVCQPAELDEAQRQREWRIIEQMTTEVIDRLLQMRTTEGVTICEDLLAHAAIIREHLAAVAERAPVVLQEYHQRLLQRTNALIEQAKLQLQLDDLKREVALFAERCDINEEVSRLGAHLDQFEKLCRGNEVAGRKLDFLTQEMLREANTIGSKANDATIAHHIVEIKGAIDRLKEQVQNVE